MYCIVNQTALVAEQMFYFKGSLAISVSSIQDRPFWDQKDLPP